MSQRFLGAMTASVVALAVLQACQRPHAMAAADEAIDERIAMAEDAAPPRMPASPSIAPAKAARPALPTQPAQPTNPLSDPAISARIAASLRSDPDMAGADVSVNTDHGVVHLAGRVKSTEQAAIATLHAQRPDGVMRIESHLAVEAG